jgi:hypothetical protein
VNGQPVSGATKLTDGDRIEIGSVEITYREGRLPLGVSVVDTASPPLQPADAMNRRSTITNPILGPQAEPKKKKSVGGTLILLVVLVAAAVWYLFGR